MNGDNSVPMQVSYIIFLLFLFYMRYKCLIWRPPSLSELTPMIFNMGLTHSGSESSIYMSVIVNLLLQANQKSEINKKQKSNKF